MEFEKKTFSGHPDGPRTLREIGSKQGGGELSVGALWRAGAISLPGKENGRK